MLKSANQTNHVTECVKYRYARPFSIQVYCIVSVNVIINERIGLSIFFLQVPFLHICCFYRQRYEISTH